MIINITSVPARGSLKSENYLLYNVSKEVGDYIYRNAITEEDYNFSIKLFDAAGDIEVSEQELSQILKALEVLPFWLRIQTINLLNTQLFGEQKKEETTAQPSETNDEMMGSIETQSSHWEEETQNETPNKSKKRISKASKESKHKSK